jgi:hypothetical protein
MANIRKDHDASVTGASTRRRRHQRLDHPIPSLSGLSARGRAAIACLERTRLWPGAAHDAVDAWTRLLRDPYHRLFDPASGCGVLACRPDPDELRRILHMVAHALPRHDARRFRTRLAELDEQSSRASPQFTHHPLDQQRPVDHRPGPATSRRTTTSPDGPGRPRHGLQAHAKRAEDRRGHGRRQRHCARRSRTAMVSTWSRTASSPLRR